MPELFGAPLGQTQAIQDMQQMAQTQQLQMKNQQMAEGMQEQARVAQIMQGLSGKGTPVEMMEQASAAALKSGMVNSGTALANDAAKLRLQQGQQARAQAQAVAQQATAAKTELALAEKLLGGVTDEASWGVANRLYEQMTGRQSPFAGQPYDPARVEQLRNETLTLKDQIDLRVKEMNAQTRAAQAEGAASFREFRKQNMAENTRIRRQQAERAGKAGGSKADVGAPTKGEIDRAEGFVKKAYPQLPGDELNDAAYTVAARARAIRKTNPGVDADEAFQRAMGESSGEFKTTEEGYKIGGFELPFGSTERTHFRQPGIAGGKAGATPQTPIATIPQNPADRQVGKYYSHGGKTYQWQKGGWKAVQQQAPSMAAAGGDEEEEEE